jgi:hypothetical protein
MHPVKTWPASEATLKAIPAALIGSILTQETEIQFLDLHSGLISNEGFGLGFCSRYG